MTYFKSAMTAILFILTLSLHLQAQQTSYTIRIDDMSSKMVHVEAELTLQDSLLFMTPNGPVPERWDDFVIDMRLEKTNGKKRTVSKRDNGWITDAKAGDKVRLMYSVSISHDDIEWPGGIDGVAFVSENGYFLTGRSLFVMNGDDSESIHVNFDVPADWNVSVPWDQSNEMYKAENNEILSESLIMLGNHEKHILSKDGLQIQFVLSGDQVMAQSEQFTSIAEKIMTYYIGMMGGTPDLQGSEQADIMVTINQSEQTDGEVIGKHISMLFNPEGHPQEQMVGWFMFTHEFFHLWNGKTLRVESTRDDWFKEGVTNYYTLKALYQVGFINEQAIAGIFNNLFYQRYQNDTGLGELSMRDAADGFDKDNHWGLIYGGGLFSGIALDVMMREQTNNEKSLDDVMRALYTQLSQTNDHYTTEDIKAIIEKISGVDASDYFETYINGIKPIPVEKYLVKAGFNVQLENGQLLMSPKEDMGTLEAKIHQGFLGK